MISDSIPKASISMASSNPKSFPKKKRANRSAKVKQNKLDARRGQFISQVNNKVGCKVDVNGEGGLHGGASVHPEKKRGQLIEKLEINQRGEEEIYGNGSPMNHYSDFESSPLNSPTSSVLGSNGSGVHFTASSRSGSSSGRSTTSSSNGCCSEIMSDEDEDEEDGCLDDWEALADALDATEENKQQVHNPETEKQENGSKSSSGVVISQESSKDPDHCRAWRPDDAFRPQSLPNLSKHYSFPLSSERQFNLGGSVPGCKENGSVPTQCPICYEDLDGTDSSFLPCLCGFRLCLFCHKKILEQDARCPGCRKQYVPIEKEATLEGGELTIRLGRSCSMITRS